MNVHQAMTQPAAWQGCFILPRLDESIPAAITTQSSCERLLARFVQISAKQGIPLPPGDGFRTIPEVAAAQWQYYMDACIPADERRLRGLISGDPKVRISKDRLEIAMEASSNLNVYQLKPVVEALEAEKAGLGWFVAHVLKRVSGHGHAFYDMGTALVGLPYWSHELEEFTDYEYARYILMYEEGKDDPEVNSEVMDALRGQYAFWPSYILEEVGGHKQLLDGPVWDGAWTSVAKASQARWWASRNASHKYAPAVKCAVALDDAMRADKSHAFTWSTRSLDSSVDDEDDESEAFGAAAFLAWDDASMLLELTEHLEVNQQQGSAGTDYARATI